MKESEYSNKTNTTPKLRPFLIGISGGSAGGKTSVAESIFKKVGVDCSLINMDSYYKNLR